MGLSAQIYGLYCPKTGALRYVGKANDAKRRLKSHLRDAKRRNTPVCLWISGLVREGLAPRMEVILSSTDWVTDERSEIRKAIERGADLLNMAPGGNQPFCPHEVAAKNGRNTARLIHSNGPARDLWELKHRLGDLLRRGFVSERTKEKMRFAAMKHPDLFGVWANI